MVTSRSILPSASATLISFAVALSSAKPSEARRACQREAASSVAGAPADPALFAPPTRSAASDSVEKVKGLIVLVDFPDDPASIAKEEIENLANLPGYAGNGNKGSLRDYFLAVSNGRFEYTLAVAGYVRAPRTKASYDAESGGEDAFVKDVLRLANDQGLDFATLTRKGTTARSVNILYAGKWGEDALWPHQGSVSGVSYDGVSVTRYQMTGLENSPSIGPILHENGHLLFDWPDLYDTDDNSAGLGRYCLMSNEDYKNPCPPNPWLRAKQGWITPTEISLAVPGRTFQVPSNARSVFRLVNPAKAGEAFWIEAVVKTGRYATWPDQGLAIWHVDESGRNTRNERTAASHYQASLEQADNLFDLENNRNQGGSGDLYKAGGKVAFGAATGPDSKWWSGAASGLEIVDVGPVKDTMTFRLEGPPVVALRRNRRESEVPSGGVLPGGAGTLGLLRAAHGAAVRADGREAMAPARR